MKEKLIAMFERLYTSCLEDSDFASMDHYSFMITSVEFMEDEEIAALGKKWGLK